MAINRKQKPTPSAVSRSPARGSPRRVASYSIAEARDQLARIVHDVEAGERVEITRRGQAVAALVPLADYQRIAGDAPSFSGAIAAFRAAERPERYDVSDDVFEGTRDRSTGREPAL